LYDSELKEMIRFFTKLFKKEPVDFSISKQDLRQYLPPNPVIVEAGVCDGSDTEEFATIFPEARIHGFECLPHYFEQSFRRLSKYSNVALYPFALSDALGPVNFHVSTLNGDYSASGSILAPRLHREVHPEIKFDNVISVEAITLDEWASRFNIGHVDFLWLDLQGAELKALHGAETLLRNVKAIFTEVSLIETYNDVPLYDEVKSFLSDRGFRIAKEYLPYKDMGNVFFVR